MSCKMNRWTAAHTSGAGDAISEVLGFDGSRAYCRVITHSFQTLYVWLPLSAVVVTTHHTWGPA